MNINELNSLAEPQMKTTLQQCCGSVSWVNNMLLLKPFLNLNDLLLKADQAWNKTVKKDWIEAFSHHPKIGDLKSLEMKFASTKTLAVIEQASVNSATKSTLEKLAEGNALYESKFGFIFIVCATGKSAQEMLDLLYERIANDEATELRIAAAELHKITTLRLQKIIS